MKETENRKIRENVTVRLEPTIHKRIVVQAAIEGRKFSDIVEDLIEGYLAEHEQHNP